MESSAMTTKFTFRVENNCGNTHTYYSDTLNAHMQQALCMFKNLIHRFCGRGDSRWDQYKRLCNEYEVIHANPELWQYTPVSRSFFKLQELLTDFAIDLQLPRTALTAVFLADGPGGFVECFAHRRAGIPDRLFGMTLHGTRGKGVPDWRLPDTVATSVKLMYGADGSGDLMQPANVDALVEAVGAQSAHFITADGGADFSANFNRQEVLALPLLMAEACAAVRLQRQGGAFVLKVYDLLEPGSLQLLLLLLSHWQTVHVVKPHTSRPANSEKYLVCLGFLGPQPRRVDAAHAAHQLQGINLYFCARQMYHIQRIVLHILAGDSSGGAWRATARSTQEHCARQWWLKYMPENVLNRELPSTKHDNAGALGSRGTHHCAKQQIPEHQSHACG
jgi:hypothetical protein